MFDVSRECLYYCCRSIVITLLRVVSILVVYVVLLPKLFRSFGLDCMRILSVFYCFLSKNTLLSLIPDLSFTVESRDPSGYSG